MDPEEPLQHLAGNDAALITKAAPPTRGWTRGQLDPAIPPGVSDQGLPRLRGDGPRRVNYARCVCPVLAAPPTRGWTLQIKGHANHSLSPSAAPPTRGWTLRPLCFSPAIKGTAAPPTRGWTPWKKLVELKGLEGCPAYAGMDPVFQFSGCYAENPRTPRRRCWLPRLRGDGPPRRMRWAGLRGTRLSLFRRAAPPTRGWTPIR